MVERTLKICDYCDDLNKTRLAIAVFERPYDGLKFDVCALCAQRIREAKLHHSLEDLNQ